MRCYKFFWKGLFSNWYTAPMIENNIRFNCVEQYMMYHKAKLFNDEESMKKILLETNPKEQKALGRNVKNFNTKLWDENKYQIVKNGVKLKFSQNLHLKSKLLIYHDCYFVEASPYDKIWGIGLDEFDAVKTPEEQWPGENLLGKIITEVKNELL